MLEPQSLNGVVVALEDCGKRLRIGPERLPPPSTGLKPFNRDHANQIARGVAKVQRACELVSNAAVRTAHSRAPSGESLPVSKLVRGDAVAVEVVPDRIELVEVLNID